MTIVLSMKTTDTHASRQASTMSIKELLTHFLKTVPSQPINPKILEEARKICLTSVDLIEANSSAADILHSIVNTSPWMAEHIFMSTFFTAIISQNVPFSSPRTTEYAMMGALLQDIGFPALPSDVQVRSPFDLSTEKRAIYETHPALGADLARRANLPEPVAQIILQHHERTNNSGYPFKLSSIKMYPLAKIVSLASAFAEFTIEKKLTPIEALRVFVPNRAFIEMYDPDAIRSLIKGFIKGKTT